MPTSCGLAARVAWDDLKAEYSGPDGVSGIAPSANEAPSAEDEVILRRDFRKGQASFYDREALREQMQALEDETKDLSDKEVDLGLRLAKAQATLSAMRTKKRDLSEENILDEAASGFPAKQGKAGGGRSVHLWGRKYRECNGDGASNRQEARDQQRQEETNVSEWCYGLQWYMWRRYSVSSYTHQLGLL